MNTTSATARPIALDVSIKAALALLLAAINYIVGLLGDSSEMFTALIIYFLALASFAVALMAGTSAANLVSTLVAGRPRRPGRIFPTGTEYKDPGFDSAMGPFSRTQVVLLALIALGFVPCVIWLLVPTETQMNLSLLVLVPIGLIYGLVYKL